ncbi:hypothetical protein AQV86_04335 [Nanohaloarchaea archaeon SG9]|nr:hypothetical protein AQV86_04335 [Nanohaloarchaea archaeon SG9]
MTELKEDDDSQIDNRFEIIFLYDVEEGNPNGDPLEENRPRIDDTTEENIVTDVRLKRTVRDYLDSQGHNIFVKASEKEDGKLRSRKEMVEKAIDQKITKNEPSKSDIRDELISKFVDIRLFGATISVKKRSFALTGPTQFKMGRSMHKVDRRYIQQSVSIPSDGDQEQGTFADRYDLPYSLIKFYGLVNENAAEHTELTREDVHTLADGLWNGTKSLITHSKMAHKPQALIIVEYNEDNYHIGGLDHKVEKKSEKKDKEIRKFSDLELDLSELRKELEKHSDKIEAVYTEFSEEPSLESDKIDIESLELE